MASVVDLAPVHRVAEGETLGIRRAPGLEVLPVGDVVPEILFEADRVDAVRAEGFLEVLRRARIREVEGQERGRITFGVGQFPEFDAWDGAEHALDGLLVLLLFPDEPVELSKLGEPQGALEFVHPVVEAEDAPSLHGAADLGVVVVAVIVIPLGTVGQALAVRHHHAALAGGQRLVVVEAEDSHVAESSELFALEAAPAGLGVVLQDQQLVYPGDVHDLVDMGPGAAHVHGNDRLGVGRDPFLDGGRVEVQCLVDVGHDRDGPHLQHRLVGRQEREGGDDHLVAWADIHRRQGDFQRRRAGRDTQGAAGPAVSREFLLELADLENPLPFPVKAVSHQDARLQDIHHFLHLFAADQFRACHSVSSMIPRSKRVCFRQYASSYISTASSRVSFLGLFSRGLATVKATFASAGNESRGISRTSRVV